MKNFFKEFQEFISKGNVMDLAVGVIIGGAFTAIVTALNTDILTPIIGILLGGIDLTNLVLKIGDAKFLYGDFLQSIINFLITAFALFCIVKAMNAAREKAASLSKKKKKEEEPAPEPVDPQIALLTEIRDLLQKDQGVQVEVENDPNSAQ